MEHLLAVDGNNIAMRAVKALEHSNSQMSVDGINTGPLVLFIQMLSKYVRQLHPDRVAVCFDGGKSIRRIAIYPEYKANRSRSPESESEIVDQFALIKEWLTLAGVFHIERSGLEADDLIGAYWRICSRMRMTILTGDKDLLQLVTPDVTMLAPAANRSVDDIHWTPDRVFEKLGCWPEHIPLMKAMVGDKSDNIAGMRGVAEKRAVALGVRNEWDIERIVRDPKVTDDDAELIRRNLALVDLRHTLGVDIPEPPTFKPTDPYSEAAWEGLMKFMSRYRMDTLKTRVPTMWSE